MKLHEFLQDNVKINDIKSNQLKQLLNDLQHIESLTQIRGEEIQFSRICNKCKIHHDLDSVHNLVLTQYTEAQFIENLIQEFDTLYKVCNWAHYSIGEQIIRDSMTPQEKAWNHILSGNYGQVSQFLNDEEKGILNSLKPYGIATCLFDFMQLSQYQNENWVLALEYLNQAANRPTEQPNKLYQWATCQPIEWSPGVSRFNEELWLNIRAELFYKVMSKHNDIYPKMRRCINYGNNKPFIWRPQEYQLNSGYMTDEIDRIGKKFIIAIIRFLTQKSELKELVDLVSDALNSIQTQTSDIKQAKLRARCYYEIGLMLSKLLDIDSGANHLFFELIKQIIKLIQDEYIDIGTKQYYLIHLSKILSQNITSFGFIFCICQTTISTQGDSLQQFLQQMIDFNFDKQFITDVAFNQFTNLSPAQQNELLSTEFLIFFEEESLNIVVRSLIPYLIENIENFSSTFPTLLQRYHLLLSGEEDYYLVFMEKDIEQMLHFLQQETIPNYWFIKYITYILNLTNLQHRYIQRIKDGIEKNHKLFYDLQLNKSLLALIAKKLSSIQGFAMFLLN